MPITPRTARPLARGLAVAVVLAGAAGPAIAQARRPAAAPDKPPALELVARFPHQVTGVAASPDGRVFVNFPRWTEDAPVSVAEVAGGRLKPYPDERWNEWRNARKDELSPGDHWVCVQSVVADGRGSLWVLDPAAPALEQVVKGGPKLVRIDLATDAVARTYPFDERAAPPGSYLNDVRFSPDGRHAYLTDSGRGALLVLDVGTGAIRRLLDGAAVTQPEKGVIPRIDGRPLRRPDGRAPAFAADGLALSPDGETLFFQAISSRTLYAVPTAALRDESLDAAALEAQVRKAGETVLADGLLTASTGALLFTSVEDGSVKERTGEGRFATLVEDGRLRWPDSLAEGPAGTIYVTGSRIPESRFFQADAPLALPTELWRFTLPR